MINRSRGILALIFCSLFLIFQTHSQSISKEGGEIILGLNGSKLSVETFNPIYPLELTYEWMIHPGIGIEGGVSVANRYVDYSLSSILLPILYLGMKADKKGSGGISLGILTLFALEHANFHLHANKQLELVPYLNLLRFRHYSVDLPQYDTNRFITSCVGIKLGYQVSQKVILNIFAEGIHVYRVGRPRGWQAGFSTGYVFAKKRENR